VLTASDDGTHLAEGRGLNDQQVEFERVIDISSLIGVLLLRLFDLDKNRSWREMAFEPLGSA
jgi:hypothetical protein